MPDTLDSANRKLTAIGRALNDDEATAQAFAELVVDAAKRRAAGRPTPQARMAATGIEARRGAVYGSSSRIVTGKGGSTTLGAIAWGAEMGSTRFRQFGARHSGGTWIFPAGNDPAVADRLSATYVEQIIDRNV